MARYSLFLPEVPFNKQSSLPSTTTSISCRLNNSRKYW